MITHPIPPIYDNDSQVLILGSFPSAKSRETGFFYGHPQNRFWKVLASVFEEETPKTIEGKKALLIRNHVALWDVIHSCEIEGSSDASIKNVVPNDLKTILCNSKIRSIYVNGKTAQKFYDKYAYPKIKRPVTVLPSTSPANAMWSLDRLIEAWRCIR